MWFQHSCCEEGKAWKEVETTGGLEARWCFLFLGSEEPLCSPEHGVHHRKTERSQESWVVSVFWEVTARLIVLRALVGSAGSVSRVHIPQFDSHSSL